MFQMAVMMGMKIMTMVVIIIMEMMMQEQMVDHAEYQDIYTSHYNNI